MSDFQPYTSEVLLEEDRLLLEEAANCADAGAFRAAFIMTWISIAESLKRRFKDLSVRDEDARKIVRQIQNLEEKHSSVDRVLIGKSRQYGMISDDESQRLNHVYELRSIYGHPYEKAPSAEAVRAAMRDAVDIVLGRPTLLREAFVRRQIDLVTTGAFHDLEESIRQFGGETRVRIDQSLLGYTVEKTLDALAKLGGGDDADGFARRVAWFLDGFAQGDATGIVAQIDPLDLLARWPNIASLVIAGPTIWPQVTAHARELTIGNLIANADASALHGRTLENLLTGDLLTNEELERVRTWEEGATLAELQATGRGMASLVPAILRDLKTGTFTLQNPAADLLEIRRVELASVQPELLRALGMSLVTAARFGAFSAQRVVRGMEADPDGWPFELLEGGLDACFTDGDAARWLRPAFLRPLLAASVSASSPETVAAHIEELIMTGYAYAVGLESVELVCAALADFLPSHAILQEQVRTTYGQAD